MLQTPKINTPILLCSCLGIIIVEFLAGFIISRRYLPSLVIVGLARVIDISLLLIIASRLANGFGTIGFESGNLIKKFFRGVLWAAGLGGAAGVCLTVLHMTGIYPVTNFKGNLPQSSFNLALFFLVGGLIGPVAEEFFFRGVIYGFLRRWGAALAILGSSVIFSLAHYLAGNLQPPHIIGGLVFAVIYELEKHLIAPMTVHVIGNLVLFTLSLLI